MAQSISQEAIVATGLPGATAATRYVGGTTNGAPTSGTFAVGDFIVDQTATIWVCTTAGTPGTWWTTISNHAVLRSATATAGKNEVTIFSGSTASQTISAVGSPVDGATWTFINQGTVNVTAGFASNSMYPLGSASSVTSYVIAPNSSYTFINYNGGNWYMTSTNDLDNGTGIVKVTNGGTGTSTAPAVGSIPVASSTSAYTPLAIGTSGQVLQSNGTTATWATPSSSGVSSFSAGTTGFTPSSSTTGAVTLAGTLAVANGGTGLTATTSGGIHVGSSTSAFTNLAIGTNGQVLTSNGTTATWAAAGGGGAVALIATVSPTASSSSFSFTSIPATYKNLKIFVSVPNNASNQILYMTVNGIASGYNGFGAFTNGATITSLGSNTSGFLGGGVYAGQLVMSVELPNYLSTIAKGGTFTWGSNTSGVIGAWCCTSATSAITSITISSSSSIFTGGGNAYLYGFN